MEQARRLLTHGTIHQLHVGLLVVIVFVSSLKPCNCFAAEDCRFDVGGPSCGLTQYSHADWMPLSNNCRCGCTLTEDIDGDGCLQTKLQLNRRSRCRYMSGARSSAKSVDRQPCAVYRFQRPFGTIDTRRRYLPGIQYVAPLARCIAPRSFMYVSLCLLLLGFLPFDTAELVLRASCKAPVKHEYKAWGMRMSPPDKYLSLW